VFVLPARLVWDTFVAVGRVLRRRVWPPTVRALAWLGQTLVAAPGRRLRRSVLVPAGRWLRSGLGWLGARLVVRPGRWLQLLLAPLGHARDRWAHLLGNALALLRFVVFARPWAALTKFVLAPAGAALAVLVGHVAGTLQTCWRIAGRVLSRCVVKPATWVWRHAMGPVSHGLRDHVWRPLAALFRSAAGPARATLTFARAAWRQARADVRGIFVGSTRGRP
jgi:hypothetical protein